MAATYPGDVKVFTDHVDITEIVYAAHVNTLQDEVNAIETTIGKNIQVSTTVTASSTPVFNANSATYASLALRLANIERGVVGDTHTQYVKNAGGSTITPSSSGTKGIVIQAASGQTANLQEWKNSGGTTVSYVDANGVINGAIPTGTVTTKGDLIVGNASGAPVRIGVGSDGTFLKADSSATNGVAWSSVPDPSLAYSYAFLTMGAV